METPCLIAQQSVPRWLLFVPVPSSQYYLCSWCNVILCNSQAHRPMLWYFLSLFSSTKTPQRVCLMLSEHMHGSFGITSLLSQSHLRAKWKSQTIPTEPQIGWAAHLLKRYGRETSPRSLVLYPAAPLCTYGGLFLLAHGLTGHLLHPQKLMLAVVCHYNYTKRSLPGTQTHSDFTCSTVTYTICRLDCPEDQTLGRSVQLCQLLITTSWSAAALYSSNSQHPIKNWHH